LSTIKIVKPPVWETPDRLLRRCSNMLWRCKDGRVVTLGEMTESHLLHCIARIFTSPNNWRGSYMPHLLAELELRRQNADRS
jgi:hypothetical protein